MDKNKDFKKAQIERLKFIEFLLQFKGWVTRQDVASQFGVSEAAATRDFRFYREMAEQNIQYNDSKKHWDISSDTFANVYAISPQEAFGKLRNKSTFGSLEIDGQDGVLCPPRLSLPSVNIISAFTRAMSGKRAIKIRYASSNSTQTRVVVPHSLVDNGLRWHARVYDREKSQFGDFVLGRVISIEEENIDIKPEEVAENDHQWFRFVKLELVPHPNPENLKNPEALKIEYGMDNGVLTKLVRAAAVGYWLRLWNVDTTPDHCLEGGEFQLWLQNHETLYDVDNAFLAPRQKKKVNC
ncbi:transcriptional regulator [Oleiphilus messinensis]|uniref:Transcriptional regulator n=1 Tax=Oleiphilus messinensis TaxID=141451 RepID=A0A1Y0I9T7_9GAMM|nr:WYL domain-containing protein [Oleiphilus messinensis]ARU57000.1 transcriptional regulator [Oleiphilus messinensis]